MTNRHGSDPIWDWYWELKRRRKRHKLETALGILSLALIFALGYLMLWAASQ